VSGQRSAPAADLLPHTDRLVRHCSGVLQWLQALARVATIRGVMCEAVVLPAEALAGGTGQAAAGDTADAGAGAGAGAGADADAAARKLWRAVAGMVGQLAPPAAADVLPCGLLQQRSSLLRQLVVLLPQLQPNHDTFQGVLLTESVTLLLLLLYHDGAIKVDVTLHLMDIYGFMLGRLGEYESEEEGRPLTQALDRLTVQLFNEEQVCVCGRAGVCLGGWAGWLCMMGAGGGAGACACAAINADACAQTRPSHAPPPQHTIHAHTDDAAAGAAARSAAAAARHCCQPGGRGHCQHGAAAPGAAAVGGSSSSGVHGRAQRLSVQVCQPHPRVPVRARVCLWVRC
jgi:hypothetical protein